MNISNRKSRNIEKDIEKLKWVLIFLTIIELLYTSMNWIDVRLIVKLEFEYRVNFIMGIVHLLIVAFFVFYIWRYMPYNKKKKINDSLMVLFLGVIGMWVWLPNKKEIKALSDLTNKN